ncbi:hypothetical protein CAPTEDRAFT_130280 [Capitella teleta]|uniref:Carrier domain-containing protein n=1 Tax=Capitella teleta TaxID=283909 RepID=R7TPF1_CAPTE|nr:hypothetical protein CAPTEDRAFT_130280 [Capitella teleta]|eukprot:ELT95442.1 hypothetical protein CAPTEDRAFT_130280 [Capitella teleta]
MDNLSVLHGPRLPSPVPCRIDDFFLAKVRENEDTAQRRGIICGQHFLSYSDLKVRADRVRHNLHRLVVDTVLETSIVAVDVQPSNDLIACLLGVLETGAAFLPVDSHSAINRVKRILNEVKPACIIIDSSSAFSHDSETVWSSYKVVDIDVLLNDSDSHSEFNAQRPSQDTAATVIYTSGSTGNPKGVTLKHGTIMNRLHWQWENLPFQSDEVCCFKTSLLFVDSLVEVFGAVLQLQPLVIAKKHVVRDPEFFVDLLAAVKITRLTLVPSLLRNILLYLTVSHRVAELSTLKIWISNSETLRYGLAKMFFQMFHNNEILFNFYGSTESMADITYEVFHDLDDVEQKYFGDSMSLGKPLQNTSLYILDENQTILPKGEIGQIGLTGRNIAEGYLNQSFQENTFISNTFQALDGYPRLFLSGDFGRIVGERVVFEGRRDLQVKIRGQRVNIMEIDKVIGESPFVSWSHVLCHQLSDASKVIVAYYKTGNAKRTKVESDITMRCQQCLPCYMRPKLVCVSDIPLQTHSGKVDGIALRKLYEKAYKRQSSHELTHVDEKSRKIMNILALNLNLPTQAVYSKKSFFELGGNSVNMVSSIVQLQQHNLHIAIEDFSRANTIQEIINGISESNKVSIPKEITETSKYKIKQLNETPDNEKIIRIFTESFIHKEPLDVLLGVTSEEFEIFAESLYNAAIKDSLSMVVTDSANGEVVAGDFLFNYHSEIAVRHHQSMAPILQLMRDIEDPVRKRLESEGHHNLLYNFCLCVDLNLQHDDQVRLCHLMEGQTLKVAKENGYSGVLTNNTNPVTQVRCLQAGR